MLTTDRLDPAGYGRLVRAPVGSVERLVETKHPERVPAEELAIREINLGTYAFRADDTRSALGVNTRAELMEVERHARASLVERHAVAGVTFVAPETVVLDAG